PPKDNPQLSANEYILGGFVNGKAQLCYLDNTGKNMLMTGENAAIFSSAVAQKYFHRPSKNNKTIITEFLEITIRNYAKGEHKELEIGGPISILQYKPNGQILSIQNDFSNRNYN